MVFPGLSASVPAELGTTDDPRALIPGKPAAIFEKLETLNKLSAGIDEASTAFHKIDTGHWQGAAGDSFRQAFSQEVPHWNESATAFDNAKRALQDYAHQLEWAQGQAGEAIDLFNRGVRATKIARDQYDTAVQQRQAKTAPGAATPPIAPFSDPGAADRQEAQRKLDEAKGKVKDSGDRAATAIGIARDSAPQGPGALERAWAGLTESAGSFVNANWHMLTGEVDAAMGLLKPLAALNPIAAFTHPMGYVTNVANLGTGLLHAANHPVTVVKGMVAWGKWGDDPAAALGESAVNLGSLFVGGEGAAAKGAEVGSEGAELAKAGEAGDLGNASKEASHEAPPLKTADEPPTGHGSPPADQPPADSQLTHSASTPTHAGPDLRSADAQARTELQSVGGEMDGLQQSLHGRLDHLDPHPDVPGGEHPAPDLRASKGDHEAYRERLDHRLEAQGRGSFEENLQELRAEHPELHHLPGEEAMAVRRYVGEDANMINRALRTGDPEDLSYLQPEINTIRSGLGRLPDFGATPDCPVVYRNIKVADEDLPQLLERYEPGTTVQENGFTSASKDIPPRWFDGNVQFVIEHSNAKDLEFLNPDEREVLWPDGNRFEVLHREYHEARGRGEWQIHLKDHGR